MGELIRNTRKDKKKTRSWVDKENCKEIVDTEQKMYDMSSKIRGYTRALGTLKVMIFSPSSWMWLNNIEEQMMLGIKVSRWSSPKWRTEC